MRTSELTREVRLPRPIEEVFPFFADAANLDRLTPPWLHFRILTERPIPMAVGTRIDYRLRLHGIPIRWQSEITEWDPPHGFVDEQRRGPYRVWIHRHSFEPRPGGTLVGDHVRYAVPGGPLVDRLFARRDLRRIFDYRTEQLQRLFRPGRAGSTRSVSSEVEVP